MHDLEIPKDLRENIVEFLQEMQVHAANMAVEVQKGVVTEMLLENGNLLQNKIHAVAHFFRLIIAGPGTMLVLNAEDDPEMTAFFERLLRERG